MDQVIKSDGRFIILSQDRKFSLESKPKLPIVTVKYNGGFYQAVEPGVNGAFQAVDVTSIWEV
jgi:hypothetical protein